MIVLILRIALTILVLTLAVAGYFYYSDYQRDKRSEEFARFAGVTAETSIAAELYRNDSDSFLIVRDSILNKYSVSINDLLMFEKRYRGREHYWAEFWDKVVLISDSLITYHQERLKLSKESRIDSTGN
ncbi:MAG: hypothetical protein DRP51_08145 [Candidatus Zixiibacteriota bacterium]|nr:MAG: hypothetical protein DRP51_08145 [candidate division Zixibacteria bacterium]